MLRGAAAGMVSLELRPMNLRIALAQINTTVGDLAGNRRKIERELAEARKLQADVVVFPEMAVTGYPPEDLLLKPDFVYAARQALLDLLPATRGLVAVIGSLWLEDDLYNSAAVLADGELQGVYHKQLLPNYGVFDENRYFRVGRANRVFRWRDISFGVSICEDIWYPDGPAQVQAGAGGAQLLINISSSPYYRDKGRDREQMLAVRAADNRTFLAYCNLIGGQDELIFDGQSMIFSPRGELLARAAQFEEELLVAELDFAEVFRERLFDPRRRKQPREGQVLPEQVMIPGGEKEGPSHPIRAALRAPLAPEAEVYRALVLGLGDYFQKNRFKEAVLGLSGGVDSSLTAALAADALGPEKVHGIALPTRFSSVHSLEDAGELAGNLGIPLETISIDALFQAYLDTLAPHFRGLPAELTEENLQPRIRGMILMALSNKFGWLVLTTGNKRETGVGYSTLYGDTAGGFAVLKDVPKTLVYALCRYRNEKAGRELIPRRVLVKPPSAELRPDQRDSDSLPPYDLLDPILQAYIEESASLEEIVRRGFERAMVEKVIRLVDRNEFKRRQSPPGVKITSRAFGKDWRLPITNRYQG
jgi:NAD+ synthase (glutamine-hydrolysing)